MKETREIAERAKLSCIILTELSDILLFTVMFIKIYSMPNGIRNEKKEETEIVYIKLFFKYFVFLGGIKLIM